MKRYGTLNRCSEAMSSSIAARGIRGDRPYRMARVRSIVVDRGGTPLTLGACRLVAGELCGLAHPRHIGSPGTLLVEDSRVPLETDDGECVTDLEGARIFVH